jgi:hypothetical protein
VAAQRGALGVQSRAWLCGFDRTHGTDRASPRAGAFGKHEFELEFEFEFGIAARERAGS